MWLAACGTDPGAPLRGQTDVRTWAGFGIVIIGAAIALTQMGMQRRQLRSQQNLLEGEIERNKRRDALLDGQLRELEGGPSKPDNPY